MNDNWLIFPQRAICIHILSSFRYLSLILFPFPLPPRNAMTPITRRQIPSFPRLNVRKEWEAKQRRGRGTKTKLTILGDSCFTKILTIILLAPKTTLLFSMQITHSLHMQELDVNEGTKLKTGLLIVVHVLLFRTVDSPRFAIMS